MAGMYPTNRIEEINGKEEVYPGMGADGKYTAGDFNNPLVPPSRLDPETINLIIDNLNSLIESMGLEPNNTGGQQLASLFSSVATANKGIKRDAHGRAKAAAPVAGDDIARKYEVDVAVRNQTGVINAFKKLFNDFAARRNNPHAVTKEQVGLGSVHNGSATSGLVGGTYAWRDSAGRFKAGAPIAADDVARKHEVDVEANTRYAQDISLSARINAEKNSRVGETNAFKKLFNDFVARRNNPHAVTKAQTGLSNCDNTRDNIKRVLYAATAGSAPANGGNATTISGINIDALNPVVASSFGSTAGYIKYRNGLLIQFLHDARRLDSRTVSLPIRYERVYSISSTNILNRPDNSTNHYAYNKTMSTFDYGSYSHGAVPVDFITIGF